MLEKFIQKRRLASASEYAQLVSVLAHETGPRLGELARQEALANYGNKVFPRALIEFSNICRNDCLYCGIRRSNANAERYRLSQTAIYGCFEEGYRLGFRSFVLQSGELAEGLTGGITEIVRYFHENYSGCALTLSLGEFGESVYAEWRAAGADRYLLRHETASAEHYAKLHPPEMTLQKRISCLESLKRLGYQTGTGFMVGSPFQTAETLGEDLYFIQEFEPHMVGIGPFIPHHDTPFADAQAGSVELTLQLLAIIRLMHPKILLPATTALGTLEVDGRERGILNGANVLMPNLSPLDVRKKYMIYDNKIATGDESAQAVRHLAQRLEKIGYVLAFERGDSLVEAK